MEITRLFDILDHYLEKYPQQEVALACKRNGEWKKFSIQEYVETTNNISYGMLKLGIQPGDKVCIISNNRPEWNMIDFATMQIGAFSVPIYPTISQDDYLYILNHAEIKMIFVEGKELRNKLMPIFPQIKTLQYIYTFVDQGVNLPYLDQLIELGKENPQPEKLTELKNNIHSSDVATIVYTSGTTGVPKGVMLSHNNIVQQVLNLYDIPSPRDRIALSFLPLCHAYERMLVYLYQYIGLSVYYAENLGTIAENIKEVNPQIMATVPRVLEKMYDKIYLAGKKLPYFSKVIYYWALNLANRYQIENSWWTNFKLKIADKLVYSKWRENIGGDFDIIVSGGSSLRPQRASFFSAIGMPVFEGYGLTETSPVIAVHQKVKNGRKFGTVGLPIPGVEVKIGEQNEILCRGHNVMIGYYKDPELTAQVIDKDGWFHTGDTGKFTPEGQLIITGRLKSLFKTSNGKYINPEVMETKFTESPFIEKIIVVGENKKFAAALISPDFVFLRSWCAKHKIPYTTDAEMIEHPEVIKRFQKEIQKYNVHFGDFEQIKRFQLVPDEWTPQNGFLSPTLKIKRNVIEKYYADKIEKLFN
ncbi:MAG TPA: long-chain fatty acid--CoA ligase [Paludibacteraceae bacterium]|nr:long-chain fatty acid--CoA ligase [Paludibacteraceae bacterium]